MKFVIYWLNESFTSFAVRKFNLYVFYLKSLTISNMASSNTEAVSNKDTTQPESEGESSESITGKICLFHCDLKFLYNM